MSKDIFQPLLELARAVEEAEKKIGAAQSSDANLKATEAKLAAAVKEFNEVKDRVENAKKWLVQSEQDARLVAAKIIEGAEERAARETTQTKVAYQKAEAASRQKVAALEDKAGKLTAQCVALEAEEAELGQKVAAYRSDLAALRAKLS